MASAYSNIKVRSAKLNSNDQRMINAMIERMLEGYDGADNNNDDAEPAAEKRSVGRPRKLTNSTPPKNSKVAKAATRGPGRPRKTDTEDAEMTRPAKKAGRPAKDAKATKSTAKNAKAAKPAAAVRKPVTADVEEMSESDLRAAAEKWGIKNNAKLLKNKSALRRVMLGIEKVVNNANRDKAWAERQAKRAGVELKFGQGRPPNTDEGWKRKIYAMMADAGAFTG